MYCAVKLKKLCVITNAGDNDLKVTEMLESIFFRICSNSPGVAPKLLELTVCLQICTLFLYLELCVDDYACTNKKRANIYAVELYASFR